MICRCEYRWRRRGYLILCAHREITLYSTHLVRPRNGFIADDDEVVIIWFKVNVRYNNNNGDM